MTDPQFPPPPPGAYAPPPGASAVPLGGYSMPTGAYGVPPTPKRRSSLIGILALLLSLIAAIVTPIIGGIAAFDVGFLIPDVDRYVGDPDSLAFLSPARDQVLWLEISFWLGTLTGVAAIVLGIVAIAQRRGRGQGIAGLIVAVLGSIVYTVVVIVALGFGAGLGAVNFS
ncbi:MAG: hypothetical protein ACQEW8_04825 [Actinomycetota bacterium]